MTYQQLIRQAQQMLVSGSAQAAAETAVKALKLDPDNPNAYFNAGYFTSKAGLYPEAIDYYREALTKGVQSPEEVENNIALIYSDGLEQHERAQESLKRALQYQPTYVPALLNLANSFEQLGARESAAHYFNQVIAIDPHNTLAHARLADVTTAQGPDDELLQRLLSLATTERLPQQLADLHFAIVKRYNDIGDYERAWQHAELANKFQAQLLPSWSTARWRHNATWFKSQLEITEKSTANAAVTPKNTELKPVFICGMFRSGSTLLEQILSAHPSIVGGGELAFFPKLFAPYLSGRLSAEQIATQLQGHEAEVGTDYKSFLRTRFGAKKVPEFVIDKRPDNFWLAGFLRQIVPNAHIIVTRRHPLDNLVSIYFHQLGPLMSYAVSPRLIAEYLLLQDELLETWQASFPEQLTVVDYETLISAPQATITDVLRVLNLEWSPACLQFHRQQNVVKTASVWQVRQPLHGGAVGRWRNFEKELRAALGKELFNRLNR